jgi:hypothetical protein
MNSPIATRYCFVFILIFGFSLIGLAQKSDTAVVSVGNQSIKLPTPSGYINVWEKYPNLRTAFGINETANNQILAMYAPVSSVAGLDTGRYLGFSRYSRVSVSKQMAEAVILPGEFNQFVNLFEERLKSTLKPGNSGMGNVIEEIKRDLKKQFGTDGGFALKEPINLGTLRREKNSYVSALIVSVETPGKKVPLYVGTGLVLTKSRVLFVYLYANVESADDIDVYNSDTKKMVDAILAANPSRRSGK